MQEVINVQLVKKWIQCTLRQRAGAATALLGLLGLPLLHLCHIFPVLILQALSVELLVKIHDVGRELCAAKKQKRVRNGAHTTTHVRVSPPIAVSLSLTLKGHVAVAVGVDFLD